MQGKAGAPLLSFFWDLASVEPDTRVTAAVSLISVLQQAQSEAATPGAACTDLAYAIRRLVRGLASPRDGARQGFGAALVELLVTFPKEVTVESILTLMEESMQLQGSMKGPEERDMLFGRVFTCAAVIRSARLATLGAKPRAALVERLVKELLFCLGKKTFLQEIGTVILCELLRQLPSVELQTTAWPLLAPVLAGPLDEWAPHALLLGLELGKLLPPATVAALLPSVTLQGGSLLCSRNLPALVAPLKAASSSHPQLHAVWGVVLEQLAAKPKADAFAAKETKEEKKAAKKAALAAAAGGGVAGGESEALFREFWQAVVEEGLLPSTLERKYMAFLLVQRAIPLLSPEQLPFALSPPLLRTLVHSIDGERDGTNFVLKPAAAATVRQLVEPGLRPLSSEPATARQALARLPRDDGPSRCWAALHPGGHEHPVAPSKGRAFHALQRAGARARQRGTRVAGAAHGAGDAATARRPERRRLRPIDGDARAAPAARRGPRRLGREGVRCDAHRGLLPPAGLRRGDGAEGTRDAVS